MDKTKRLLTKTKSKKKKGKAFRQKVKVFRSNDPKLSVIMWGVNHSLSQMSYIPQPVMLMKDDFKAHSKIKIDNHLYNKENMPGHFKFKEYMPLVFRNLRERFNVDEQLYARAFMIQPRLSSASGNSGAKFLQTHDRRFYVKCISREEVEMMHNIMPKYHQFIVEVHADTMLPQYVAMYRTTVDSKEYYYLVCRSIFSNIKKIHKKYDLKGSRVDREAKDSEKEKDLPTFKDNDFSKDHGKVVIGDDHKENFMAKLKKDIDFLVSLNVMDYSLLIGIHDRERLDSSEEDDCDMIDGEEDEEDYSGDDIDDELASPMDERDGGMMFRREASINEDQETLIFEQENRFNSDYYAVRCADESRHELYYLGIIDVLTYYGATKKAAHAAKTVKHGAHAEISTVKPQLYASRFLEFIESVVE